VVHNTALNSSDNLHSYPPDIHHSSGQLRYVCWREGITRRAPLAGCPREDCVQARCDGVPVFTRTGRHPATSLITSSQPLTLLLAAPSTICQQEPSHCASLSTQHVRLSGVPLRRPDSLELAARWFSQLR